MNVILPITGFLFLYGFATLIVALRNAPVGVQDGEGFHAIHKSPEPVKDLHATETNVVRDTGKHRTARIA
jgi:hypothetical protein